MKTVLITGSAKGIGFETARLFGREGFRVILSGRDEKKLETAQAQLSKEDIPAEILLLDVSNENSVRNAAAGLHHKKIRLDVLINNAGILLKHDRLLHSDDEGLLRETMETNAYGPLRVCKHFLPLMQEPGRIIMVSSGGGSMHDPIGGWSPAYCTSKTWLNALTRHLAHELETRHISVNAVCPGWVRSDMGGKNAPRTLEQGASTQLWLGTVASQNTSGKFFRDKKEIPW